MIFRNIVIGGEFDQDDYKLLCETVRKIEQKRPHVDYVMTVDQFDADHTVEEAKRMLFDCFPKLPNEEPFMAEMDKKQMIESKTNELGRLAMQFRSSDENERESVAAKYAKIVNDLIKTNGWNEGLAPEEMLPNGWMPKVYFEHFGLTVPEKKDGKSGSEGRSDSP